MMSHKKLLGITVIAASIGLAAGCASTEEMKKIRAMAEGAESTASQAQQTASEAMATADEAKTAAQQASDTANEALRVGEEANSCCGDTNQKIDRAFKRSMAK